MTTHVREILDEAATAHEGEFANLNAKIEALKAELKEAKDNWQAESEAHDEDNAYHEEVLTVVKYWMQDALVLHKPITDPRKILRMVEDAL